MSMKPELVYKTTDPEAVQTYLQQEAQRIEEHNQRVEVMRELSVGFEPDPESNRSDIRRFYTTSGWAGEVWIRGIAALRSEWLGETPLPSGWRIEKKRDIIVPALATKRGKEIKKLMESAPGAAMADLSSLVGMPDMVFFDTTSGHYRTRPLYVVRDEALYVLWTTDKATEDIEKAGVDHSVKWERIKLSEWFLVAEAIEAESAG